MSVNSSSTSNSLHFCTNGRVGMLIYFTMATLKTILLVPLSTFVLYLGHQRWRQHCSSKPVTHIFTYHVAATELIWIMGIFCYISGTYTNQSVMIQVGIYISAVTLSSEAFFHILTCVERYLAVVHPITYMGLKNARGVKIRNICIGCVWLLCFGLSAVFVVCFSNYGNIPSFCFLVPSIILLSFCSLSVVYVLIHPGPGEAGGKKSQIDQSKQRAFHTITAISVAVWLWFVGVLVSTAVDMSPLIGNSVSCVVTMSVTWLNLPSSLVSPLLYLHREGKLSCFGLIK